MNMTRRWFIGGAASFGALSGCKVVRDPLGIWRGGRPNLKFGVISDIHVIAENVDAGGQGNTRTLEHAFRWFDAEGVDGVMIAGDMADAGLVSQLQCVADAWYKVFPDDKSKLDGRHVEKLFIYGNHDWEGFQYGYTIFGRKSGELDSDKIRVFGAKKAWERVFDEPYAPVYRKTLKGYDFIGAHWDGDAGAHWQEGMRAIDPWFAANGRTLDPAKPFFYFQHPHPKDTCYGAWAWGHDSGISTRTLMPYRNAVAFSGHSHYSLLDERSIWQGTFTSLGTGSLRYAGLPYDEFSGGFENAGGGNDKTMEDVKAANERNGYLVSVFDDRIVYRRRDFLFDCDLGPDWVMPLPAAESMPFQFPTRAARAVAPEFSSGTKPVIKMDKQKRRGGKEPEDALVVTFPAAPRSYEVRAWRYDVCLERPDGTLLKKKRVLASDFHLPLTAAEHEVKLAFLKKDLPADGEVRVSVTPYECFGKAGRTIVSESIKLAV